MSDDEEQERDGFGSYKKPTIQRPQQPQKIHNIEDEVDVIEFDEVGMPIRPKRPLTQNEKKVFLFYKLFRELMPGFTPEIMFNLRAYLDDEIIHYYISFAEEQECQQRRIKRIEKQLNIIPPENERIGLDDKIEAENKAH